MEEVSSLLPLAQVIEQHGLRAKKTLGQHFLLDRQLLANIVRVAGNLSDTEVIEVGPGPGGLTRAILEAGPRRLTAIEKDTRCLAALAPLKAVYGERFVLLEADALHVPLRTIGSAPRKVIANLPYNVGTMLVIDWLKEIARDGRHVLESFTVMLQKEVAERMVAKVGDRAYGRLSVIMEQYCESAIAFDVPAGAFSPPPKVVSSVLHATVRAAPLENVPLALLERVTAAAFNNRRKMLRQSLKSLGVDAIALCEKAGIDPTLRAEKCDLAMFAALARTIS